MERYQNLSGDSGVTAYTIGQDSITVRFRNDSVYLYSYSRPGPRQVEHMKLLARKGRGLNTYISTLVKDRYERKLK